MPLTQPERDNPLMRRYFDEIGVSGQRLAKRCGVSHSQIYMARKRNVGADNARKIARGVARILGLSEGERLELVAEITGHPGEPVRAWLGHQANASRVLDVSPAVAAEVVSEEKSITHSGGTRALRVLRRMGAPDAVLASVERGQMPPPEPRRGLITHDLHGPEMVEQRKRTREGLRHGKPAVHEALGRSGLTQREAFSRAGVGKKTFRRALYEKVGSRSARMFAGVLGEGLPAIAGNRRPGPGGGARKPPEKAFLRKSPEQVSRTRKRGQYISRPQNSEREETRNAGVFRKKA